MLSSTLGILRLGHESFPGKEVLMAEIKDKVGYISVAIIDGMNGDLFFFLLKVNINGRMAVCSLGQNRLGNNIRREILYKIA